MASDGRVITTTSKDFTDSPVDDECPVDDADPLLSPGSSHTHQHQVCCDNLSQEFWWIVMSRVCGQELFVWTAQVCLMNLISSSHSHKSVGVY